MANKLKDIFSKSEIEFGGSIRFATPEAYKNFLDALKIVGEEGKTVEVEGVSSISTELQNGNYKYPFSEFKVRDKLYISPSTENVPITFKTEMGERTLEFKKYCNTSDIVLETDKNAIVFLKLSFKRESTKNTLFYRTQPELAKSIEEIIDSYNVFLSFLKYSFEDNSQNLKEEYDLVERTKKYFYDAVAYFKRARQIEELFGIQFHPAETNEKGNDERELEELYLLLCEKQALRLNAKLNGPGDANITKSVIDLKNMIGKKIEMTFSSTAEYHIYGQKISIYTAILLANAIIQKVQEEKNGKAKIWYCENDSEPMFISYMGFKTLDDRDQELETLMKHKQKYLDAVTVEEYMQKKYS